MPSIRSAMPFISLAAAAASASSGAEGRLRSCCRASPASDNSSAMTSAANSSRRSSPAWPSPFANSVILLSTYCASRRVRVSCPSAQESGKSRPLTLTTTSAISAGLLFQEPVELCDRRLDAAGDRGRSGRHLVVAAVHGVPGRCGGFEPRHGASEPRQRVGKPAQRLGLNPAASMHLLVFLQGEAAGPVQVVPLRLVFTVAVEHLHTVVLAVGDINPAIRVGADVVDDVELAGIGAGLAP